MLCFLKILLSCHDSASAVQTRDDECQTCMDQVRQLKDNDHVAKILPVWVKKKNPKNTKI